jgi:hypothetical protein
VNRRGFVLALGSLALVARASAQEGATRTQIDLALASASLAALLTRYGDAYPDVVAARARIASLSTSLREARARNEAIDVALVTRTLDGELADVRARLAEFGTRCGAGHTDTQTARAREAALANALTHVTSDGYFVP